MKAKILELDDLISFIREKKEALENGKAQMDGPPELFRITKGAMHHMLVRRRPNRPMHMPTASRYAKMMDSGEWYEGAVFDNPLKLDRDGVLVAGQHRAMAFGQLSKRSEPLLVSIQWLVSEQNRLLQDSNKNRTKSQSVFFHWTPDKDPENIGNAKCAAVGKLLAFVEEAGYKKGSKYASKKISEIKAADALRAYELAIFAIDRLLDRKPHRDSLLARMPYLTALIYIYDKIEYEAWMDLVALFANPVPITEDKNLTAIIQVENCVHRDNERVRWYNFLRTLHYLRAYDNGTEHSFDYENPETNIFAWWENRKHRKKAA